MKSRWQKGLLVLATTGLIFSLCGCRLGQRLQAAAPTAPPGPAPVGSIPSIDVPGVSGVVLFQDDFQDGQAEEWTISSAWSVQQSDNLYVFGATGYGGAWLAQGQNWENYIFRAGARVDSGNLSMNINVSQSGRYILNMRPDGVFLLKEYPAGNYTLLAQSGPFTLNIGHAVAFASQDGHLQVYVDRVLWMDVTDSAPLPRGTIAVGAQDGSRVGVDNVLVMGLSTPLPSGVAQAPAPIAAEPPAEVLAPPDNGGVSIVEVGPPPDQEPPPDVVEPSNEQPDLVLERITMQPSTPEQGQAMVVAVTVRNGGEGQAGAFNIRWNPEGANFVGCSWDVFGLPAGEAIDMVCDYQGYPQAGSFNWGVTADADGEVAESDEGNNSQSGEILVIPGLVQEAPPPPVNCRASGWTSTSVTIAWEFPGNQENIEGFSVYQGTTSLEKWVGPPSREATIGNLQSGVQYHFDVRAYNDAGESGVDACFIDVTIQ